MKQPMRLLQAMILALMVCFGGSTHTANARCLVQTPSEAFRKATLVFLGKVVSIQDPALPAAQLQVRIQPLTRELTVQFTVERVLQGTHVNEVKIQTMTGAPESGYPFQVGEKYLVYANEIKGGLVVGGCSRTRPAASAQEDLSFILGHDGPRNIAIKPEELSDLVRQQVSSKVKPAVGVISEPVYVLSDFNGDGYADIVWENLSTGDRSTGTATTGRSRTAIWRRTTTSSRTMWGSRDRPRTCPSSLTAISIRRCR